MEEKLERADDFPVVCLRFGRRDVFKKFLFAYSSRNGTKRFNRQWKSMLATPV
jgi:hypothetical protein